MAAQNAILKVVTIFLRYLFPIVSNCFCYKNKVALSILYWTVLYIGYTVVLAIAKHLPSIYVHFIRINSLKRNYWSKQYAFF